MGMPAMPNRVSIAGLASTSIFAILSLPSCSLAISSSTGATIRQGPHHSAQKSTSTGSLDLSTSASNVPSDTWTGFVATLPSSLVSLRHVAISAYSNTALSSFIPTLACPSAGPLKEYDVRDPSDGKRVAA